MTFPSDGEWSLYRCGNSDCGLIWLDPAPEPDEAMRAYEEGYYTHDQEIGPLLGRVLLRMKTGIPGRLLGYLHYLKGLPRGRLLDVGCGNGRYLYEMRRLGWRVEGLEPDPLAARIAREKYDLHIHETTLEDAVLVGESYDVVTLNHVIEHLPDPAGCLSRCHDLLKPGGKLIVRAPNALSLGHSIFGKSWFPLDVPRHYFVFSPRSLGLLARKAGFEVRLDRTTPVGANLIFSLSRSIRGALDPGKGSKPGGSKSALPGLAFMLFELLALATNESCGEEMVLFLSK
jgi:SAM-dependent methyltransferase